MSRHMGAQRTGIRHMAAASVSARIRHPRTLPPAEVLNLPARVARLACCLAALVLGGIAAPAWPAQAAPTPQRWSQLTEVAFQHLTREDGLPHEIATAVA